MVSTRGGARTGPATEIEPELSLRKKPMRKITTKTPTATKSNPSRTAQVKDDQPGKDSGKSAERQQEAATKSQKPPKKEASSSNDGPETLEKTRKTEGPQRPVKTKERAEMKGQMSSLRGDQAPKLPAATQSRATRPTRATEAKAKAQPLSPKKVTQVARAPSRQTRSAASKTQDAKKAQTKAAPAAKASGRRRAVSNENEDIQHLHDVEEQLEEVSGVETSQATQETKTRTKNNKKLRQAGSTKETSEHAKPALKQTRATRTLRKKVTKPAVKADDEGQEKDPRDLENLDDDPERDEREEDGEDMQLLDEEESTAEHEKMGAVRWLAHDEITRDECENEMSDVSIDELCGPKTPMKRCSPRESAKHLSPLRTILPIRTPQQTPVQRLTVLSTRQGTPQTQKPYSNPQVLLSEMRPTTVSRAHDRAMVYSKLTPLKDIDMNESSEDTDADSTFEAGETEDSDDNESDEDELEDPEHHMQFLEGENTEAIPQDIMVAGQEMNNGEIGAPQEALEQSHVVEDASDDSTVLINEDADDLDVAQVLSGVDDHDTAQEAVNVLDDHYEIRTSTQDQGEKVEPETLVWESITQQEADHDSTNDFVSEEQFLPQVDATEMLTIASETDLEEEGQSSLPAITPRTKDAWNGALTKADTAIAFAPLDHVQRLSVNNVRESYDATVNISDFIDVDSLSAPSQDNTAEQWGTKTPASQEHQRSPVSKSQAAKRESLATPKPFNTMLCQEILHDDMNDLMQHSTPGYALPTVASMTRRKSLPAFRLSPPFRMNLRPNTSDGSSSPGSAIPRHVVDAWTANVETLVCPKFDVSTTGNTNTSPTRSPWQDTSIFTTDLSSIIHATQTQGRYSEVPSFDFSRRLEQSYSRGSPRPQTPASQWRLSRVSFASPDRSSTEIKGLVSSEQQIATSTPLTSRKSSRKTYGELSKTALVPTRFLTPSTQVLGKRSATTQKPASKRRLTFRVPSPARASTPTRTPLKVPGTMTPGTALVTPHPSAPLRSVVALVEVFTNDGAPASTAFASLLQRLGARTTKTWSERVTHVVFKEGSPTTLQRVRLHNKSVAHAKTGTEVFCVNSRWVSDCDTAGRRMDESDEAYVVEVDDVAHSSKRRRKSMEPATLLNLEGNIVRERKSSLGRRSLSRTLFASDSPASSTPSVLYEKRTARIVSPAEKENSDEGEQLTSAHGHNVNDAAPSSSPATPAYLAAPSSLLQQTAPARRIRKLDLGCARRPANRRKTLWPGQA